MKQASALTRERGHASSRIVNSEWTHKQTNKPTSQQSRRIIRAAALRRRL